MMDTKETAVILAKKYAQAFLHTISLTMDDIRHIQASHQFLVDHKRVLFFLNVPFIDIHTKRTGLYALCTQFQLPPPMKSLFDLLLDHKRISLLADVLAALVSMYYTQENIITCTITSSHALTDEQLAILQQFLMQSTGHTIMYTYTIDPHLIAGIRLQSNVFMWEYSVRKQLHAMYVAFISKG